MSTATESKGDQPLLVPKVGHSLPIGATLVNGGANFSVFSRSAASVELLLFDRVDDALPSRMIPMDPSGNRTYHYWHVYVPGLQEGQIYGFRAFGRFDPARGLRFDPPKLLIDPYGRAISVPTSPTAPGGAVRRNDFRLSSRCGEISEIPSGVISATSIHWDADRPLPPGGS